MKYFILLILLVSCVGSSCPSTKHRAYVYGDRVTKIYSGFYKGSTGKIIDKGYVYDNGCKIPIWPLNDLSKYFKTFVYLSSKWVLYNYLFHLVLIIWLKEVGLAYALGKVLVIGFIFFIIIICRRNSNTCFLVL